MNQVIQVQNVSKRYRIGARLSHNSLRDSIASTLRAPFSSRANGNRPDFIWALNDVSFSVDRGEVVGIIGRNGAGKSTLLKILSKITKPTKGTVRLQGRVGSLLEVGTGFHSELTGRENIFLNGAILGMTRREIMSKFDEIVAFAETEQFLDTPVKHYSSGMTVRLAFAVAAHLEPEILIVDEVLAVGDAVFQKKCLGKMDEVARGGRTILFVSHDLSAVNSLCQRAILLHEGSIVRTGSAAEVSAYYLDSANKLYSPITWVNQPRTSSNEVELQQATISQEGKVTTAIDCRKDFRFTLEYEIKKALPNSRLFIVIRNAKGEILFTTSDYDVAGDAVINRDAGRYRSVVEVPGGLFKAGAYYATVGADIKNQRIIFAENDILQFDVYESADDTQAERHKRIGVIAPLLNWETRPAGPPSDR